MIFVPNELTDPRINLALETFLLQELTVDEPILLFYINEPSIIIRVPVINCVTAIVSTRN